MFLKHALESVRLGVGESEELEHSEKVGREVERKERDEVDELENVHEVPHGFDGAFEDLANEEIEDEGDHGDSADGVACGLDCCLLGESFVLEWIERDGEDRGTESIISGVRDQGRVGGLTELEDERLSSEESSLGN